jgi:hypothetical protein
MKSDSIMPMKNECTKWKKKDALLEATLAGSAGLMSDELANRELEDHLSRCPECARDLARLRARQQQIDAVLPLAVRGAGPQPGFETRVLAAAAALDASRRPRSPRLWIWTRWAVAGAVAALATVAIGLAVRQRTVEIRSREDLIAVQKLAQWRAPSDVLLQLPGQEIMRTTPKLGESYLNMSLKTGLKLDLKK